VGLINSLRKLLLGQLNVKVEREDILKMMNGMVTKLPRQNTWILLNENIHIQADHILVHKI
jgi:hypothetical protein